jgi:hypothetical protein
LQGEEWQKINFEAPILSVSIPVAVIDVHEAERHSIENEGRPSGVVWQKRGELIEGWEQITRELGGVEWRT